MFILKKNLIYCSNDSIKFGYPNANNSNVNKKTLEVFGLNYDTVFEDGGQIIFLHI